MVLAGVVALAQTGVTFSAPAEPASRLLPELGKAVGFPMEAAPRLAREVLLVRVKDVPLADLMKRIAQATGGEWEEKDGVYRLTLSGPADARERRAEGIARGEAWDHAIRERIEARSKRQYSDGRQGLAEIVLAAIPAETLGSLGFKERVVFSTQPTAMQRSLPLSALQGVDLTQLSRPADRSVVGQSLPPAGRIEVVQLAVQPTADGSMLQYSLAAADANGRVVGGEAGSLWPDRVPTGDLPKLPLPEAILKPSTEESKDAIALAAIDVLPRAPFGMGVENENGMTISSTYSAADLSTPPASGQVPTLLHPETVDPLSLTAGPLLAHLAEGQGENLVADLPDAAFIPARSLLAAPEIKAARVLTAASTAMGIEFAIEGSWIVVRPRRPWSARAARLDRETLGTALRALAKEGDLSLDAQAAYAEAQPLVAPGDTFEGAVFGVVNADYGKRMMATCGSGEREVLRLYRELGSLRPNDARAFGSLPPAAQAALDSLVFDSFGGPTRSLAYGGPTQGGLIMMGNGPQVVPWSLGMERTVYWGQGIPLDATLRISENSSPAILGLASSGARPRMSEGGSSITVTSSQNGPVSVATSNPRLDRYAEATVRRIEFRLTGGPGVSLARALEGTTLVANQPTLAYGDLPEALRKKIENTQEQAIRLIEQSRSHGGPAKP